MDKRCHVSLSVARVTRVAAFVALVMPLAAGVHAKGTLVYCSEGSPEGFQPQFFSTGTTFDAASVPMFNRLVAVRDRHHQHRARAGGVVDRLARRQGGHVQAAPRA